jgi:Protein of unknown function (DUF2785)
MRFSVLIGGLSASFLAVSAPAESPHAKEFWGGIVAQKFQAPDGLTPAQLAPELLELLGSTDGELRDDFALSILETWIYKRTLPPDDVRSLVPQLLTNLRAGVDEPGTDAVFLRSFSALTLAAVIACDNEQPFLRPEEFRDILAAALGYFAAERDLRGFDSQRGWIHSIAHTSDLLKILARSPRLQPADQPKILEALVAKVRAGPDVFGFGEDERMARVVISISRREDLDREALRAWLGSTLAEAKFPAKPTTANLRVMQNARHLLISLWAELSTDKRPSAGADFAKDALREALQTIL